jgi:nucleotide-binding universal stress UspA family protein
MHVVSTNQSPGAPAGLRSATRAMRQTLAASPVDAIGDQWRAANFERVDQRGTGRAGEETLMNPYRQVIVPSDDEPDEVTITVARRVADLLRVPVVLVSIVSDGLEQSDQVELQQIAARVAPDAHARVVVDDGRPTSEQLADLVTDPSTLMCMRSHARPAILGVTFSRIGDAVVHASRSGVLMVGPSCAPALSGSRVIIAVEPGSIDERQHQMARDFAFALDMVPERVTVVDEPPAHALSTLSQNPDVAMIVMTIHDKGLLDRVVIGSTTSKLIRHAECPVLVYAVHS